MKHVEKEKLKKERKKRCKKCKQDFTYTNEDTFWDENGFGYSTRLVRCKYCNNVVIVEHVEDKSIKFGNRDRRYYEYGL